MTETDLDQLEVYLQHITRNMELDNISMSDIESLINLVTSLRQEIMELRACRTAGIKMISQLAQVQR